MSPGPALDPEPYVPRPLPGLSPATPEPLEFDDAPGRAGRSDHLSHDGAYDPFGREWPRGQDPGGSAAQEGRSGRRGSWVKRRLGPILAALVALGAKLKAILLFLPKIKVIATAGTMLVSIAAYTVLWGVPFAVGFVLLLLVHELGHVIALKREGIKASAPMFIPFLGAVVTARSLGDNALAEARVGLAGPILGSIGAAACVAIYGATGDDFFRALAFTGFFLNLFNLLPVVPLDGGRAMAAMAPWMWIAGFVALIPLVVFAANPILVLILLVAGMETYRRLRLRRSGGEAAQAYYKVKGVDRLLVAGVYLSLIALLVVGMHATNLPRTIS